MLERKKIKKQQHISWQVVPRGTVAKIWIYFQHNWSVTNKTQHFNRYIQDILSNDQFCSNLNDLPYIKYLCGHNTGGPSGDTLVLKYRHHWTYDQVSILGYHKCNQKVYANDHLVELFLIACGFSGNYKHMSA